ncbi:MAG: hypothetical protein CMD85_00855 [Gammaproteobacteria bacterium]|nr:hypothetical protein [Gammaproteobacteria bacterium]
MNNSKQLPLFIAISCLFFLLITGCSDDSLNIQSQVEFDSKIDEEKTTDFNEDRNLYFGDTHVHTKYSFDAYIFGTTASPDDAYSFAKGAPIKHPLGFDMQLSEPLDFYAVTDHGFFLGMFEKLADTSHPASSLPGADPYHDINAPGNTGIDSISRRRNAFSNFFWLSTFGNKFSQWRALNFKNNIALSMPMFDYAVHKSAWKEIAESAQRNYEPGKFTTFIGYEFTTNSGDLEGGNLHRNVLFENSNYPKRPWTRIDSMNPEDLWAWMDRLRNKGLDSIAIPHNSNGSNGRMFETKYWNGNLVDTSYADLRSRNEPLVESTQVKGTSDTHPLLSPDDEWADFEIFPYRIGRGKTFSDPGGSYVRQAYRRGIGLNWEARGNPYKFGVIGSSDTHTAAGAFVESDFYAKVGVLDGLPPLRGTIPLDEEEYKLLTSDDNNSNLFTEREQGRYVDTYYSLWSASGLAAVWAEENTRESIFAAFRRKETYATSGNRIKLRFFAGLDYQDLNLGAENLIKLAYDRGVPMGSDLVAEGEKQPAFLIWAQKDQRTTSLQRLQVIKGWVDPSDGSTHEKIYDAVCSDGLKVNPNNFRCPDNGARVDLADCSVSDTGAAELKTLWSDPDFNPNHNAFYYVRVLENPSCRWTAWDAVKNGRDPREDLDPIIQDRAWSSPIWYIAETEEE